jgi:hypothetical protein
MLLPVTPQLYSDWEGTNSHYYYTGINRLNTHDFVRNEDNSVFLNVPKDLFPDQDDQ